MQEMFPIAAGVAIGLLTQRFAPRWLQLTLIAALSLVFGLTASVISGELALGWGFVPVDVVQVLLAAGLMTPLVAVCRRAPRAGRQSAPVR